MDKSELARLLLDWEVMKTNLDTLEAKIKDSVMDLGESVQAGNVKATYYKGQKRYNYKVAVESANVKPEALEPFEKISIDYRAACEELEIADVPFTQSAPSVTLKK